MRCRVLIDLVGLEQPDGNGFDEVVGEDVFERGVFLLGFHQLAGAEDFHSHAHDRLAVLARQFQDLGDFLAEPSMEYSLPPL